MGGGGGVKGETDGLFAFYVAFIVEQRFRTDFMENMSRVV